MVTKLQQKQVKQIVKEVGSPVFVYSEETLTENIERVRRAISNSDIQHSICIYVSYFANSNPHIATILKNEEIGLTLQSVEENEQLKEYNLLPLPRVISSTHLSRKDLEYFIKENISTNYATLSNLEDALKRGIKSPSIRVDLSPESNQRHGIKPEQFSNVKDILKKYAANLHGIQMYAGTGNDLDVHLRYQIKALECLNYFLALQEINLGGGFKFDYECKQCHFDWDTYFNELQKNIQKFKIPRHVKFSIEPGRDILADSGFLIVKVTGKDKIFGRQTHEIFTDGSYVHIPSATIRARQHKLQFYNSAFKKISEDVSSEKAGFLSGNTTLSSDRLFPGVVYFPSALKEGDYIILEDVGAYCATQHMDFLNKSPCPEVLIRKNGNLELITERGRPTDRLRYVLHSTQRIGGLNENKRF